eukprot:TRINITY_DN34728_c0_g1_i1.p1 TRINITY_DN34728_c0_g1~~TRINITY_DN34728_c0_g1_i1.p1  ORF type:complete len:332 (-),score=43.95 TRINITY_DN34728_c0_g1_i1:76-1071(-)
MGKNGAIAVCAVNALLSLCWLVVIAVPTGWHNNTHYLSYFYVGLYQAQFEQPPAAQMTSWIAGRISANLQRAMDSFSTGSASLTDARERACTLANVLPEWCNVWIHLQWCGFFMIMFGITTIICYGLSAGFTWYYWYVKPKEVTRHWNRAFQLMAPLLALVGVGTYASFTYNFGTALGSFSSQTSSTFGVAFYFAVWLCVLGWIPLIIDSMCNGISVREFYDQNRYDDGALEMQGRGDHVHYRNSQGGMYPPGPGGYNAGGGYGGSGGGYGYPQQGYGHHGSTGVQYNVSMQQGYMGTVPPPVPNMPPQYTGGRSSMGYSVPAPGRGAPAW